MNKAFYISSLILSVLFSAIIIYYIALVAGINFITTWYQPGQKTGVMPEEEMYKNSLETIKAGWISLFFFSFFLITFLIGIIKIKRLVNSILSVIGLSLTVLYLLWDLAMMNSPSHLGFDEAGIGFLFFIPVVIVFSIVGIVEVNRYKRLGVQYKQPMELNLLDS